MEKNLLLVSLGDERSKSIAEVLGSESCKKILNLLAEKELSESEISNEISMPLNTVDYNVKKLLLSGLIEKSKHWWSIKGKRIETYKLSNKYIVIAPKTKTSGKIKSSLFTALIAGLLSVAIFFSSKTHTFANKLAVSEDYSPALMAGAQKVAETGTNAISFPYSDVSLGAIWFFAGAVFALIILLILNWKKL